MVEKIKIKAQDLFKSIDEKYKYITKEKFNGYIKAWQFKPIHIEKISSWVGSNHTKRELGYSWLENESELDEREREIGSYFSTDLKSQSWWEVEDFINIPVEQCVIEREV